LKSLTKDVFFLVTSDQCNEELKRYAFINGRSLPCIDQCFLEVDDVNLSRAFKLVDSLDKAQCQSLSIDKVPISPAKDVCFTMTKDSTDRVTDADISNTIAATRNPPRFNSSKSCYFCGKSPHVNHSFCPAQKAICHKCARKGHFLGVCRSVGTVLCEMFSAAILSPVISRDI